MATTLIRETGQVASPAFLMMCAAVLALLGSLWVDRYGGNVMQAAIVNSRRSSAAPCRVTSTQPTVQLPAFRQLELRPGAGIEEGRRARAEQHGMTVQADLVDDAGLEPASRRSCRRS